MRITNKVLSNNMLNNMYQSMWKMSDLQNQVTTGRKVNKPSDDPSASITSLRMRTKIMQNEQFQKNATEITAWMNTAEDSLIALGDVMQRARELAVKGATDTNDQGALDAIADEIDQLLQETEVLANSQVSDRYLFGGTRTTEKTFTLETMDWSGNDKIMNLEIGEGILTAKNIDGKKIFGITEDMDESVFATLQQMSADLRAGNNQEVGGEILTKLDGHIEVILSSRSEVGARLNRMEMTMNRLDGSEMNYLKVLSDAEDADLAEVIIRLKEQENVYNATLSTGARVIQPTLMDFLR